MKRVILLDPAGGRWLVPLGQGKVRVKGIGTVQTDGLDRLVGRTLEIEGRRYVVLSPSVRDLVETIRRKAQIIGPKDSPFMVFNCGLGSGDVVAEGGAGSGAMTIVLAHAVQPEGKVISYEVREDFLRVARENVERAGLSEMVEFRRADICEGIEEDVNAVVLDIPEPWRAVEAAWKALTPSGHLASYSPTVEQMRQTVLALRQGGFVDVWSCEVLERRMEVNRGTRPAFEMLGHTGYMTFARKALEAP